MGKGSAHADASTMCGLGTPPRLILEADRARACQDFPVVLIFVAHMIGVAAVAMWAYDAGDPGRLIYGSDSYGNVCGRKHNKRLIASENAGLDLEGYPHLYRTLGNDYRKLCVAGCPTKYDSCHDVGEIADNAMDTIGVTDLLDTIGLELELADDAWSECELAGICIGRGPPNATAYNAVSNGSVTACPDFMVDSITINFIQQCAPSALTNSSLHRMFADELNSQELWDQMLADFHAAKISIMVWIGLSAAGALVFVAVMQTKAADLLVWGALWLSIAAAWFMAGTTIYFAGAEVDQLDDDIDDRAGELYEDNRDILVAAAVFLFLLALLWTCLIISLRKHIGQAIKVMQCAARALGMNPQLFVCPFITYAVIMAYCALWLVLSMYIMTADNVEEDPDTGYVQFNNHPKITYVWLYMLFSLFWMAAFVHASMEFMIASTMVIWYLREPGTHTWPVTTSFTRLLRYHFGSIAFGSFLVAVIQTMRAIIEYIKKTSQAEKLNSCSKFMLSCCTFACACVEKCVKMINKVGYVQIAIWGDGFCNSCLMGMTLMVHYATLCTVSTGVSWLVISIVKVLVVMAAGGGSYLWLKYWDDNASSEEDGLPMYGLVVGFITIMSALVVSTLMAVYEMAATSMLIMVLEDYDEAKTGSKTSHMENALPNGQLAAVFPVTRRYAPPEKKRKRRKKKQPGANATAAEAGDGTAAADADPGDGAPGETAI